MQYNMTARLYGNTFPWMLKSYYKKHFLEMDFSKIKKKLKAKYRAMVERTPGLGGSSMESYLIGACFFFAMVRAIPDMTPELMNDIIAESIQSSFMQKAHQGKRKKERFSRKKIRTKSRGRRRNRMDRPMKWTGNLLFREEKTSFIIPIQSAASASWQMGTNTAISIWYAWREKRLYSFLQAKNPSKSL